MRTRSALAAVAMLVAVLAAPSGAAAEERTCTGAIGAETVDDLRVPDGATCTLSGTHVKGTAKVETAATLRASGVRVVGNVQAENAADVVVHSATVGGSVQVKQGGGAEVTDSSITGDVQYDANSARLVVSRNRVNGNVQVVGNRSQASIFDNTIEANLQCKENDPPPVGGNNVVKGSAEDQCGGFAGGAGADAGTGSGAGGPGDDRPAPTLAETRTATVGLVVRRRGGRLVLSGRVFTARRSLAGLHATVQVRRGGRWRDAKSVRTSTSGRYRATLVPRRSRRLVRVVVKRQAGMPVARASRTWRVR